jgi:hypothetical protein
MKSAKVIYRLGTILAMIPAAATADDNDTRGTTSPSAQSSATSQSGQDPSTSSLGLQGPRPDTSQMRRGPSIRVNEVYTAPTLSNCTYRATVTGTLQEWTPQSGQTPSAATPQNPAPATPETIGGANVIYTPRLRINAQLQCPDRTVQRTASATMDGPALTHRELERVIGDLAVVTSPVGDRVCLYSSEYAFTNNRLAGRSLSQRCMPVVGGGPGPQSESEEGRHGASGSGSGSGSGTTSSTRSRSQGSGTNSSSSSRGSSSSQGSSGYR